MTKPTQHNTTHPPLAQNKEIAPHTSRSSRPSAPRSFFRRMGKISLVILLLVCLMATGGVLLLRTSWAEKHLTTEIPAMVNPLLAEQGLRLELEAFSGPLPGAMTLHGLSLYDQEGLFLHVETIQAHLSLLSLLRGNVTVPRAHIESPSLYRFPTILPTTPQTPPPPSDSMGLAVNLPLDIHLESFVITKALLPWELLGLSPHPLDETPTTATVRMPQHEDTAPPMGQKTASVKKTNTQAVIATAPSIVSPEVVPAAVPPSAVTPPIVTPLAYSSSSFSSDSPSDSNGSLGYSGRPSGSSANIPSVSSPSASSANSPSGSSVSSMEALPDAPLANPTFAETITSFQATQHAWNDALATDLRLDLTASAHLVNGSLKTSLALQGRDGNTLPSLHRTETPTSALPLGKTDLSNTLTNPSPFPQDASTTLAPSPKLLGSAIEAEETPKTGTIIPPPHATLEKGDTPSRRAEDAPLTENLTIGTNFYLTLNLNTQADLRTIASNHFDIVGTMGLSLGGIDETTTVNMTAGIDGDTLTLHTLALEGFGIALQSSASLTHALNLSPTPTASFHLSSTNTTPLQNLISAVTGQDPTLLQALLEKLALQIDVSSLEDTLVLNIPHLQAGILTAQGQGTMSHLSPHDAKDASHPNIKSLLPSFDAVLVLQASNLEKLSSDIQQGDAKVTLKAKGELPHIQADIELQSPNLTTSSGELHNLVARLSTSFAPEEKSGGRIQGNLHATATPTPIGPTAMRVQWDMALPQTTTDNTYVSPFTASFQGMDITVFGLALQGNLHATASPKALNSLNTHNKETSPTKEHTQPPSILWPAGVTLTGDIQASVVDWAPLSLFAQAPLVGHDTKMAMVLSHNEEKQHFRLHAKSSDFQMHTQGVSVKNLDLDLLASLPSTPQGHPELSLSLASGKGKAADIAWHDITASLTGNSHGDFSFRMTQDAQNTATATQSATIQDFKSQLAPDELALLKGQYSLTPREIHLETLAVKEALSQTVVQLRQGVSVQLDKDIHLPELTVDLSSGGSITAAMAQQEHALKASATVENLPMQTINDFAGTTLPAGHLEANLHFMTDGTLPQGSMQAALYLTPPKGNLSKTPTKHTPRASIFNKSAGTATGTSTGTATSTATDATASTTADTPKKTATGTLVERTTGISKKTTAGIRKDTQVTTADTTAGMGTSMETNMATNMVGNTVPNTSPLPDMVFQAGFMHAGGRSYLSGDLDFEGLTHLDKKVTSAIAPIQQAHSANGAQATIPRNIETTTKTTGITTAPLTFRLPLTIQDGIPLPDMNGPFQATLRWLGPLDGLWRFVPLPDTEFSAMAAFDLGLSGTLAAPKTNGTAFISQGRFYNKGAGVFLTDLALEAHASRNEEFRLILAATDGDKGTLGIEGAISLHDTPAINLRGQIKHLTPLHRDDVTLTLTGLLGVKGPLATPKVTADILVERGEVSLVAAMGNGSVRTLPISAPTPQTAVEAEDSGTLDVKVNIPKRFYIRGMGLDSEWQGNLHIHGPFAEPQLVGSLKPFRGYFELISKPFAFTGGDIVFAGGSKINPGLNLELTYAAPDLEAVIKASGNLEKPSLDLQSRPPLPKDEVLAHVLFGKKMSELSRFEALQLANSMSELAGISNGNLNPLTNMRKATGLDVLRFGSDADNQEQRQNSGTTGADNLGTPKENGSQNDSMPTLEAGKYINDSIYIGVEQGVTQESTGVRVEIELFPNTTVQGKTTSTSSSAGIGWKMDY